MNLTPHALWHTTEIKKEEKFYSNTQAIAAT